MPLVTIHGSTFKFERLVPTRIQDVYILHTAHLHLLTLLSVFTKLWINKHLQMACWADGEPIPIQQAHTVKGGFMGHHKVAVLS